MGGRRGKGRHLPPPFSSVAKGPLLGRARTHMKRTENGKLKRDRKRKIEKEREGHTHKERERGINITKY